MSINTKFDLHEAPATPLAAETEDVRPHARGRARAMLSLYTGRPVDPSDDSEFEAEPLADLLTDLLHLAAGYDALREGEPTVLDSALHVFHSENHDPSGPVVTLPAATIAAAAAL